MLDPKFLLNRLTEICEHFHISSLNSQLDSVRAMLAREGTIDIAVLGRFKAGKSSFLNHLAHESILPVGVIPVTSVITRLRYGREQKITVIYNNGRKYLADLSEIADFISETNNPGNQKSVKAVEVDLPQLKPYEGLEFIDTPGLGSVFKHNTEVSLDWLPRVGAAIVAMGVDPPLSEHDIELISKLLRFTPKVIVLLTKADILSQNHLKQVLEFVEKQLCHHFSREFPIYFYSTDPKYSELQDTFKREVIDPLVQARSVESQCILNYKINNLLLECSDFLRIALEASERSQAEREKLRQQILGEKLLLEVTRDELRIMVREWLGRTRPSYVQRLSELEGPLLSQFTSDLANQFKNWHVNLYRFTRAYESWMRTKFEAAISGISVSEQNIFYEPLNQMEGSLTRSIQSFQSRLNSNVEEYLGIQMKQMKFEMDVKKPGSPDISIGRAFDSHLDHLWFLIPMIVFRKWIENHFLNQLPFEVEKNLSRLTSQWTERINAVILNMGKQADRFVIEQVQTIESLLLRTTDPTLSIQILQNEVDQYQHQMTDLEPQKAEALK